MALKMTNREVDGVSVEALDGRIVLGEESNALREKVKGLLAEGKKKNRRHRIYRTAGGDQRSLASHSVLRDADRDRLHRSLRVDL